VARWSKYLAISAIASSALALAYPMMTPHDVGASRAAEKSSTRESFSKPSGEERRPEAPANVDHPPVDQLNSPTETWSDLEVLVGLQECAELLTPLGTVYDVSKPIRNGQCGSPSPVLVRRVADVEITPPTLVNCRVASRLHHWIQTKLQPTAEETLGARISKIVSASGYSCRQRIGTAITRQSEHSFANAFDVSAFITTTGETIDILTGWGATVRDARAQARAPEQNAASADAVIVTDAEPATRTRTQIFLRKTHEAACGIFSTVLGPEANEAHRNHMHFDLAPRRGGAFCE
jgi:hypothetical protein